MAVKAELIPVSVKIEEEGIPGEIMYLFPGQGAQEVGMGKALYENSATAQGILDQLQHVKPGLLYTMFNGPRGDQPIDMLDDTANAQPAIVAVSLATYFEFLEKNPSFKERRPLAFLGHSTSQVSAMGAAGVVDIGTALHIAAERGRLMKEVGERKENKGGMLGLLGSTLEQAESLCAKTCEALREEGVWVANDNTVDQVVLSGRENHIAYAAAQAKEVGIKKAVLLRVPIAGHCPLMEEAQDMFAEYLAHIRFDRPISLIILNTTAAATLDPDEIKADLVNGLTLGVRFREALQEAQRIGVASFVEIGEGPLSGFAKKVIPDSMQFQITP
ncbi:MAG: ACP S-malonyltransferase [Candidatus Levybacteria bacterium]|nr:ACP S-malonyltransferase [Candidatus Levybacteria bacterium]